MTTTTGQRKKRARSSSVTLIANHPVRFQCWSVLRDRVASPNQLKDQLGLKLSDTAYHVGVLRKAGVIELVETKQRRGATEHFYRAVERPDLTIEQVEKLTDDEALKNALGIVQMGFADVDNAIESGTLCSRPEHFVGRLGARVDAEGFAEIGRALDDFLERFYEADAASAERMRVDPSIQGIPIIGLNVFGEMPATD